MKSEFQALGWLKQERNQNFVAWLKTKNLRIYHTIEWQNASLTTYYPSREREKKTRYRVSGSSTRSCSIRKRCIRSKPRVMEWQTIKQDFPYFCLPTWHCSRSLICPFLMMRAYKEGIPPPFSLLFTYGCLSFSSISDHLRSFEFLETWEANSVD